MNIKFSTVLKGIFEIKVEQKEKVSQIKKRLEELKGFPSPYLKLIFRGEVLQDDKTLQDYKINQNSFLICLPKMDTKGTRYLTIEEYQKIVKEEEERILDEEKRLSQQKNCKERLKILKEDPNYQKAKQNELKPPRYLFFFKISVLMTFQ
jgi:hypothetical protein